MFVKPIFQKSSGGLANLNKSITGNIADRLVDARGPEYFDVRGFGGAQSEMQTFVVGREIASCRRRDPRLSVHLHMRAEAVAVAARSVQSDGEPVQFTSIIYEYLGMAT